MIQRCNYNLKRCEENIYLPADLWTENRKWLLPHWGFVLAAGYRFCPVSVNETKQSAESIFNKIKHTLSLNWCDYILSIQSDGQSAKYREMRWWCVHSWQLFIYFIHLVASNSSYCFSVSCDLETHKTQNLTCSPKSKTLLLHVLP